MDNCLDPGGVDAPALGCTCSTDGTAVVLALEGEVDISTADLLEAWLIAAAESGLTVVVDLAGVGFLDSSGCKVFAHALARGPLVVRGARGSAARCLEITGLDQVLCDPAPVSLPA
jgi:anti-anti-sigma factor